MHDGNLLAWKSARQKTVATSTTNAEINAMYQGAIEVEWTIGLLQEIGMKEIKLEWRGDNQAAIKSIIAERNIEKTRHILVKVFFLREHMEKYGTIPKYLRTEEMTADIFTKALNKPTFTKHRENLKVIVDNED
jgi:hypothetical protein